ncbi:MAG: beta-ketoacyl-[acyl-carrier-protein] synthase family protein [Phycisphaerales bacterium]
MARSVVITGLGAVSALGTGFGPLWEGLCAGRSGITPITRFDASGFPCRMAGAVPAGFSAKDHVPKHYRKAVKVMARDIELAVAAAKFAVEDAGLVTRAGLPEDATEGATYAGERMGCHIGAGLIAAEADELAMALATASSGPAAVDLKKWGSAGMESLTPLWLLKYLPNMLACHVTILHGCEGPSNTITCAEASGLLSIGESMRVIERGSADLCFSGGAESKLNLMGLLRMDFAGRVARTESTDPAVMRPFDEASAGGLIGEAGGLVILEAAETAAARGARPYAALVGIGAAHSLHGAGAGGAGTGADEGYRFAIESALDDAGLKGDDIDAVVPTGFGIPAFDSAERGALTSVFGDRLARVPVVAFSPLTGNSLAGTGGLQAAVACRCLREQTLPACTLLLGPGAPRVMEDGARKNPGRLRNILAVSGTPGGQNAAVVLSALN